jgi:hypothetical protein
LPDLDWDSSLRIQLVERCLVGAAFIHRHFFSNIVVTHGLGKEVHGDRVVALGCQREVDGFALLIDHTIERFPGTLYFDVGLIHAPTSTHWALVLAE